LKGGKTHYQIRKDVKEDKGHSWIKMGEVKHYKPNVPLEQQGLSPEKGAWLMIRELKLL
jgi:hypothetical protein